MAKRTLVRGTPQHRRVVMAGAIAVGVVVLALPFVTSGFRTFQFTLAIIYAIAVLGLNLLTGYSGQISLGHSAFFGIGAYTSAILIVDHEWPYLLTLPVAAVICFAAGFLIGIPALRLQGLYLALMTLGLAIAFPPILRRFESVTGGVQGINVRSRVMAAPEWMPLSNDQYLYFLVMVVAVVLFVLARNLVNSRVGRSLTALRDNEIPAQTMGIYPARYKTLVFAISASYAGIAGVLYVYVIRFVAPTSFLLTLAIILLAAMVVGGLATISGAIFGGIFIQFVPFYAEEINQGLSEFVFGAIIIAVMLLMPGGFMEGFRRIRARFVNVVDPPAQPSGGVAAPTPPGVPHTSPAEVG